MGTTQSLNEWPAPAKLNLFLHVVGRRVDGLHELQTLFQLIDHVDRLGFAVREDGDICVQGAVAVHPEDDLTVRAAYALKAATECPFGVDIVLEKRIPVGSGLGGGSSDAATVLLALNRLWATGLGVAELASIGLTLGADVPVFVHGHSAFAEGIGERLTPIALEPTWYCVLIPAVSVSTARVFSSHELTRNTPRMTIPALFQGEGRNDLEPVTCVLYPEVRKSLDWLRGYGDARMTGTGGASFLPVGDRQAGLNILNKAPPGCTGFVAQGLNRHPLVDETKFGV
ncbi:MAG: 4-(cytidine 5'-diphospho)-2-C-methyl-D-erythritol kinase [Acidiferrobacteraceae bacterium]|nr:4-(cytidine 5'-diphospho)-2-C-methyl-D-erythritol kinase [Acidiferrobacteraceae bacterium]